MYRDHQSPTEQSPLLLPSPPAPATAETAMRTSGLPNQSSGGGGGGTVKVAVASERQVKRNLNLSYEYYEFFVYSQCLPAWLLLLLRLLMGGVCVSVFLYMTIMSPFVNFVPSNSTDDGSHDNSTTDKPPSTFKRHFYLCYLTIWSYLVITVYFITTLVNTLLMCSSSSSSSSTYRLSSGGFKSTENLMDNQTIVGGAAPTGALRQFGLRLQWLLCGVAANAALLVTVAYFGVLYPMIRRASPGPVSWLDLLVHAFNSVFMLVEVACSGVPVRLVHAVYTALYGLCYCLFSLFYWLPDHSNVIYPVLLDWNHVGLTVGMMCLILFVGLPLIQLVWWLVYLARCFLAAALVSKSRGWSPGLEV